MNQNAQEIEIWLLIRDNAITALKQRAVMAEEVEEIDRARIRRKEKKKERAPIGVDLMSIY